MEGERPEQSVFGDGDGAFRPFSLEPADCTRSKNSKNEGSIQAVPFVPPFVPAAGVFDGDGLKSGAPATIGYCYAGISEPFLH